MTVNSVSTPAVRVAPVRLPVASLVAALMVSTAPVAAQHAGPMPGMSGEGGQAAAHAYPGMTPPPAGVMMAHTPAQGKVMTMYSRMWMHMEGLQSGTDKVSAETVVTTVPNRFFAPGHAPTVRMVPTKMNGSMQMFGAMYGITDSVSAFVAGTYLEREMEMLTFRGMMGTQRLGTSTGKTEGFGDMRVGGAFKLLQGPGYTVTGVAALSIPTGSIEEQVSMVNPMGMRMTMRAVYGMQLGTGTYDAHLGLTYMGGSGPLGWGAAYRGQIGLEEENENGWSVGDRHAVTGWLSYAFNSALSGSARLEANTQGEIEGMDPVIRGAALHANPDFYGGQQIEAFLGVNAKFALPGYVMGRIGVEAGTPLYQDLNGVQLERDWSLQMTSSFQF